MVECYIWDVVVAGSNPVYPTIKAYQVGVVIYWKQWNSDNHFSLPYNGENDIGFLGNDFKRDYANRLNAWFFLEYGK